MRRLWTPLAALALLWGAASSAGTTCATTVNVVPGGLQAALDALSTTTVSGGDYCVMLGSGVYPESLSIQGVAFGDVFSRVVIVSTLPAGGATIVGLSTTTPAFTIANASVTLQDVSIATTAGGGFAVGVAVSSSDVTLSSVTVVDPNGLITSAGVSVTADRVTIADSSITATGGSASALAATDAAFLTVLRSTFTGNLDPGAVLTSVSSSTISSSYFGSNGGAVGLRLLSSPYNTVSQTTVSYSGATAPSRSTGPLTS